MALPLNGHAPTAQDILLFQSIDVLVVEEGEVTVVSIPFGAKGYVLEQAMGVVRDGGADRLA